ncbi:hypothetical protein VTO73DRAFT_14990 [Trametes versicolor]
MCRFDLSVPKAARRWPQASVFQWRPLLYTSESKCPKGPVLSTLTSKAPVQGDIAPRYISEHCVTYAPWLGAVFVCDELYELIDGKKNIEAYKNGLVKLALLFIGPSEPIARKMDKGVSMLWSLFVGKTKAMVSDEDDGSSLWFCRRTQRSVSKV